MEWVEWAEGPQYDLRPACPDCREMYAAKDPPEDPPCDGCLVELMQENREAAAVYMAVRGQVVTAGMGTVIDISLPAIKIEMDLQGVMDQRRVKERVAGLFHRLLKKRSKP